jgi:hypothetical protein
MLMALIWYDMRIAYAPRQGAEPCPQILTLPVARSPIYLRAERNT